MIAGKEPTDHRLKSRLDLNENAAFVFCWLNQSTIETYLRTVLGQKMPCSSCI